MSESNGHTEAVTADELRAFSALLSRMDLASRLGWTYNGSRTLHATLGYKGQLEYRDFKARFLRQDIAKIICTTYPEATWASTPMVREDASDKTETPFETDWRTVCDRLRVYAVLEKADVLNNIGQYSVIFLGLANQSGNLAVPSTPVRGPEELLYLMPYSEEWVTVATWQTNPSLPRFCQPETYQIDFGRSGSGSGGSRPMVASSHIVHASRLIHIAEETLDDEVYGLPRLESVYDRLDDLLKIVGGSAEMFWRDAKRRLVLSLRDGAVLTDSAALTEHVEEYMHGFRDFLKVQGMDVTNLTGTVPSPEHHIDMLLTVLAIATGIPRRRWLGQNASLGTSGDVEEQQFQQRIRRRRVRVAEGLMLRPLIDRLIGLRVLRASGQAYAITWPEAQDISPMDRADIAHKTATAAHTYASGLASTVIPGPEFRETVLGLSPYPDIPPATDMPQA